MPFCIIRNSASLILCFTLLSACGTASVGAQPQVEPEHELAKMQCLSKGGNPVPCPTAIGLACSIPTKDAGKSCLDSDECEAECIAPPGCKIGNLTNGGTCAKQTMLICQGIQTVEDGKCQPMVIS